MRKIGLLVGVGCSVAILASRASAVQMQITTPQQSSSLYSIFNTNNQIVSLNVSGGTSITGAELFVQIADGGVDNSGTANNGGAHVPIINTGATHAIDMTQGIFSGNNPGNEGETFSSDKLLGYDATNTNSGTVPATGLLGTLNLDATGVTPGTTFTLQLYKVGENSSFGGATSDWFINNTHTDFTGDGMTAPFTLTVVAAPEPATGFLMIGGIVYLLALRKRSHA